MTPIYDDDLITSASAFEPDPEPDPVLAEVDAAEAALDRLQRRRHTRTEWAVAVARLERARRALQRQFEDFERELDRWRRR